MYIINTRAALVYTQTLRGEQFPRMRSTVRDLFHGLTVHRKTVVFSAFGTSISAEINKNSCENRSKTPPIYFSRCAHAYSQCTLYTPTSRSNTTYVYVPLVADMRTCVYVVLHHNTRSCTSIQYVCMYKNCRFLVNITDTPMHCAGARVHARVFGELTVRNVNSAKVTPRAVVHTGRGDAAPRFTCSTRKRARTYYAYIFIMYTRVVYPAQY